MTTLAIISRTGLPGQIANLTQVTESDPLLVVGSVQDFRTDRAARPAELDASRGGTQSAPNPPLPQVSEFPKILDAPLVVVANLC
jgi:hypothetical protein